MNNLMGQVLDKLNIGIIVIDRDQKIIIWNNWLERYTKKPKSEMIDRKLSDVCPRFSEKGY